MPSVPVSEDKKLCAWVGRHPRLSRSTMQQVLDRQEAIVTVGMFAFVSGIGMAQGEVSRLAKPSVTGTFGVDAGVAGYDTPTVVHTLNRMST